MRATWHRSAAARARIAWPAAGNTGRCTGSATLAGGAVAAAMVTSRTMATAAARRTRTTPRVRQHVNPLKSRFQVPCAPPEWDRIFERLDQPLFLDVGCGAGVFAHQLALERPDWNVLAVDIRHSVVNTPLNRERAQSCPNLHFMTTNINVSLEEVLRSVPASMPLRHVALLHPDPWVKKKHHKRRFEGVVGLVFGRGGSHSGAPGSQPPPPPGF